MVLRLFCVLYKNSDQYHIADRFRQHQHPEYRNERRRDGDRNIEQKRQRDEQPVKAERAYFFSADKEQVHDDRAERDERHVANYTPDDRTFIFEPSVLRQEAKRGSDRGKSVHGDTHAFVFPLAVSAQPQAIHKHIEDRHRDRSHEFADPEPHGKIGVDKVIQHSRDKVERVPAAEDQRGKAHQFSDLVFARAKNEYPRRDGKQEINYIKRAFSVFHDISPLSSSLSLHFIFSSSSIL